VSVRLEMQGLAELRAALRQLPQEMTDEAATIVDAHARLAESQIKQNYPQGPTGNLRRGVTRDHYKSGFTARAIVKSRAKHASIFENGTQTRRTANGANRGRMPAPPESQRMIPVVIRRRKAMVEALKDLVRRAGFQVQ
jgi:hypothetical protein